jgi:DNA-binding protein HU-beta
MKKIFSVTNNYSIFAARFEKNIITNNKKNCIMTKAEIVTEIAQKTGIEKAAVQTVVENFMDAVKASMINGENVYLRGFGSFIIKTRAEKKARNISKKTTIVIPAHNIPAFKPSKTFSSEVKNKTK